MRNPPPLAVLVLGGVADRWASPPATPLALARKPHLDRLASEGRVLGARLARDDREAPTAAP
ncbi:MAG: hypothetical protein L0323_24185, partial [Planctomycetes bacterium]|nr:hypothetical protein [Planctomycetota bacterium]